MGHDPPRVPRARHPGWRHGARHRFGNRVGDAAARRGRLPPDWRGHRSRERGDQLVARGALEEPGRVRGRGHGHPRPGAPLRCRPDVRRPSPRGQSGRRGAAGGAPPRARRLGALRGALILHLLSPHARGVSKRTGWIENGIAARALRRWCRDAGMLETRRFFEPTRPYTDRVRQFAWEAVRLCAANLAFAPTYHLWLAARKP